MNKNNISSYHVHDKTTFSGVMTLFDDSFQRYNEEKRGGYYKTK